MSITYRPPGTEDLAALKAELGKSNPEMAELFGMTPENWRKYTGGKNPRPVSPHMLFFAMARLVLPPEDIERVLARMRKVGAVVDLLETTGEEDSSQD
jgi:hypothetical protein